MIQAPQLLLAMPSARFFGILLYTIACVVSSVHVNDAAEGSYACRLIIREAHHLSIRPANHNIRKGDRGVRRSIPVTVTIPTCPLRQRHLCDGQPLSIHQAPECSPHHRRRSGHAG